jgi:hypothetical protein
MALRSNEPLAGLRWLKRALGPARGNPKAVVGGAALVIATLLLPMLVSVPLQFMAMRQAAPLSPVLSWALMAFWTAAGLLLFPVYAGYFRVIDAVSHGRPASARDVFLPYRQGEVLRFAGYALVMTALYFAVMAMVVASMGGGILQWYGQALSGQMAQPPAIAALPPGFGRAMALAAVLGLWIGGVYAIGLGQVALGGRSVLGAIGDGVVGSLKNALPLLVLALGAIVAWIVIALAFVLVGGVVALLGKLVGTWLMIAFIVLLYIALLLGVMVAMFSVMHQLWRDVCSDDAAPTTAHAVTA